MSVFLGFAKKRICLSRFAVNRGQQLRLTRTAVPTLDLPKPAGPALERRTVNRKSELQVHRLKCAFIWQAVSSSEVDKEKTLSPESGKWSRSFLNDACAVYARIRVVVTHEDVKSFADVIRFSRAMVPTLWTNNKLVARESYAHLLTPGAIS